MNFLKKKLKPLASGLTSATSNHHNHPHNRNQHDKDLEDDLYDEYVVEAPPHPSELLALGVDPTDIDVNDPDKLRELYKKAKEEGKDKKTNSVLLAKQRQKEEIEEKKKTREEWKFFDSLTARVEQVVKESQKNLDQLRESSAIDQLAEPEYELRLSADQIFKSSATVKAEKSENNWIDFNEDDQGGKKPNIKGDRQGATTAAREGAASGEPAELDEFGCSREKRASLGGNGGDGQSAKLESSQQQQYIVEELLEDFGIDLRPADQRKQKATDKSGTQAAAVKTTAGKAAPPAAPPKPEPFNLKEAARPRPRPNSATKQQDSVDTTTTNRKPIKEPEEDPFDTSFISEPVNDEPSLSDQIAAAAAAADEQPSNKGEPASSPARALDPFDTSYVNF